jgi:head-tail adaptor
MAQLTLPSGQVVTYNYRVPKEKKPLSNKNFAWEMTLPCGCRCSGSTIATYRAEVRGLTGREQLQAGQIDATLSTAVVHRFVDDDAPGRPLVTHRYLVGSRVLVIVSVFDLAGDRRELKALCTEAAA